MVDLFTKAEQCHKEGGSTFGSVLLMVIPTLLNLLCICALLLLYRYINKLHNAAVTIAGSTHWLTRVAIKVGITPQAKQVLAQIDPNNIPATTASHHSATSDAGGKAPTAQSGETTLTKTTGQISKGTTVQQTTQPADEYEPLYDGLDTSLKTAPAAPANAPKTPMPPAKPKPTDTKSAKGDGGKKQQPMETQEDEYEGL